MTGFFKASAILGILLLPCAFAPSPVVAAPPAEARLWLQDVQDAEQMIAAGLKTGDAAEIKRQSSKLARLLGRIPGDLAPLPDSGRMACAQASQALYNVTLDVELPPARALVAAKADLAIFRDHMPKCERTITGKALNRKPI